MLRTVLERRGITSTVRIKAKESRICCWTFKSEAVDPGQHAIVLDPLGLPFINDRWGFWMTSPPGMFSVGKYTTTTFMFHQVSWVINARTKVPVVVFSFPIVIQHTETALTHSGQLTRPIVVRFLLMVVLMSRFFSAFRRLVLRVFASAAGAAGSGHTSYKEYNE